jgi:hypothetical protein
VDHHAIGFAQGRAAQPQFRENLLHLIDAHLTMNVLNELGKM